MLGSWTIGLLETCGDDVEAEADTDNSRPENMRAWVRRCIIRGTEQTCPAHMEFISSQRVLRNARRVEEKPDADADSRVHPDDEPGESDPVPKKSGGACRAYFSEQIAQRGQVGFSVLRSGCRDLSPESLARYAERGKEATIAAKCGNRNPSAWAPGRRTR
eukprot:2206947-Pyramimonas_sp.AAC.1